MRIGSIVEDFTRLRGPATSAVSSRPFRYNKRLAARRAGRGLSPIHRAMGPRGFGGAGARLIEGPPSKVPSFAARHGKKVAAAVVLAGGYHAVSTRTRGVNRSSGRPTGLYDY